MKRTLLLFIVASLLLGLVACGTPAPIPNPPLVLGEKYLTDLEYEQALLSFDQAIEIEPKNPRGYLGKADALLHLNRPEDAASALATGAKATRGDVRDAITAAQAEVEKSPVDGYIGIAACYEKLGWKEVALALLKRVCEELPEESRLREALEGMVNAFENVMSTQQISSTKEQAPWVKYYYDEMLRREADRIAYSLVDLDNSGTPVLFFKEYFEYEDNNYCRDWIFSIAHNMSAGPLDVTEGKTNYYYRREGAKSFIVCYQYSITSDFQNYSKLQFAEDEISNLDFDYAYYMENGINYDKITQDIERDYTEVIYEHTYTLDTNLEDYWIR